MNAAFKAGIITEEHMNVYDLSAIANIVLYGGNGDEAQRIKNVGYQIVKEISKNYRGKRTGVVFIEDDPSENDTDFMRNLETVTKDYNSDTESFWSWINNLAKRKGGE